MFAGSEQIDLVLRTPTLEKQAVLREDERRKKGLIRDGRSGIQPKALHEKRCNFHIVLRSETDTIHGCPWLTRHQCMEIREGKFLIDGERGYG